MSIFKVNIVIAAPVSPMRVSPPIEVLVDTGSELSWLPSDILASAGIVPVRKRNFLTATKQHLTRDVGYAIVRSESYETIDEVVFAEPADMHLLGVRTLEGFGVMVDNIAHRFVATSTLAV
jgi:predicted aspartyl protease